MNSTQDVGLARNTRDKYYTSPDVVRECIEIVKKHISVSEQDIVVEPSAGNGAFISCIQSMSTNCIFFDLYPEHSQVTQQDYLSLDIKSAGIDKYANIHTIGNPPFGRQSSMAIKFIKRSCMWSSTVSFILPKSFKKDSMKKHFPTKFHLLYEHDLPTNAFLVENKPHHVPCVFQIWRREENDRYITPRLAPRGFRFVTKEDEPDISFRRVGANAGKVERTVETKAVQSHYFIKLDNGVTEQLVKTMNAIVYTCKDNTVGPRSISKQEVIEQLNRILEPIKK